MNIIIRAKHRIEREYKQFKIDYKDRFVYPKYVKEKPKIFCIGRNKTGTTSFKKAMQDRRFIVGNQPKTERLLPAYKNEDFKKIINYCKSAQVFQDFPFSFPNTYRYLDEAYPNAKFVLTVRDSPDQWYDSLVRFHSKRFGQRGKVPTKTDLQNAMYRWKGFIWAVNRTIYNTPENDIYNKEILIKSYNDYNNSVKAYFKGRPEKLLIINVSEKDSYIKLMDFLEIDSPHSEFPWENKTSNIKTP